MRRGNRLPRKVGGICGYVLTIWVGSSVVIGAEPGGDSASSGDAGESASGESELLSPDDLGADVELLFEDFEIVVSAGRRAQPLNLASVPVSILDSDDLHYGGMSSIPMMLDFVPGVDVQQVDRNGFATGVRGLHQRFSDRTLLLLDGRVANNALYGGFDMQRLPIFMEDIERIEVVRGPGSAAWGPNAFTGVINIIKKDPRDTAGAFISVTGTTFGDLYTHVRGGIVEKGFAIRASAGYDSQVSSQTALGSHRVVSDDSSRSSRFDTDGVYEISADTDLSFGYGYTHLERSDFEFLSLQTAEGERIDDNRWYAKIARDVDDDTSVYVQLYGSYEDELRPSLFRASTIDNTLEGQISKTIGNHDLAFGVNGRLTSIDAKPHRSDTLIVGRYNEQWAGVFGMDRWQANERLVLEAQLRADWYSGTGADWGGRVSALYALDDNQRHVLRVSGAKAFRAPQVVIREMMTQRIPIASPPAPPGLFGATLLRAGSLENEELWSIEGGYRGEVNENIDLRVDGYYQLYEDLTGAQILPDPSGLGLVVARIDNLGNAHGYGIETEVACAFDMGTISGWYTFQKFEFDYATTPNARGFSPASHKAGISGRTKLGEDTTLNVNYRFTGWTPGDAGGNSAIEPYHRLDITAAHKIADGRVELMVGIADIFDETSLVVDEASSRTAGILTPGRTLFVRIQLEF